MKVTSNSRINPDGSVTVSLRFTNGETREYTMAPDHPLFTRAALHGLNQKFRDSFAGVQDPEEQISCFEAVAEQLSRNEWALRRVSAEEAVTGSYLARAVAALTGRSLTDVKAFLQSLSREERQALELVPEVAEKIRDLRAAKVGISTADIRAKLGL